MGLNNITSVGSYIKKQTIRDWEIYSGCEFKVNIVKLVNQNLNYQKFTLILGVVPAHLRMLYLVFD